MRASDLHSSLRSLAIYRAFECRTSFGNPSTRTRRPHTFAKPVIGPKPRAAGQISPVLVVAHAVCRRPLATEGTRICAGTVFDIECDVDIASRPFKACISRRVPQEMIHAVCFWTQNWPDVRPADLPRATQRRSAVLRRCLFTADAGA